jgi:hypothetical protein
MISKVFDLHAVAVFLVNDPDFEATPGSRWPAAAVQ